MSCVLLLAASRFLVYREEALLASDYLSRSVVATTGIAASTASVGPVTGSAAQVGVAASAAASLQVFDCVVATVLARLAVDWGSVPTIGRWGHHLRVGSSGGHHLRVGSSSGGHHLRVSSSGGVSYRRVGYRRIGPHWSVCGGVRHHAVGHGLLCFPGRHDEK